MKKNKTIFVVMTGEMCDKSSVVSNHTTKPGAVKAAKAVKTHFPGGWVPDGEDVWINGCDFVEIIEQAVVKL